MIPQVLDYALALAWVFGAVLGLTLGLALGCEMVERERQRNARARRAIRRYTIARGDRLGRNQQPQGE